ncbi:MAG: M48 family metalloprotease [Pseudonocardiales bacterium]
MSDGGAALRPNPFAVPSGTLVRFLLLIAVASAAALSGLSQTAAVLLGVRPADVIAYQVCVQEKKGAEFTDSLPGANLGIETIADCHDPRNDIGVWPNVLALAFFWLVVLALYWVLPRWRIWRRRLRPLDPAGLPELAAYLNGLQQEAGVREPVSYLLAPLNSKVAGLAFGHVGRRHVMLSGGLVALFNRDRAAFRTVVLHELAHIRNRDLDITFITIIVWRVVMVLLVRELLGAGLNIATGVFPGYGIASTAVSTWQIILLAVVVPLARNAVLRSRELYADARTAQWDNSSQNLQHLFDTYSRREHPGGGALRVHPPLTKRRAALDDPRGFFALEFWEMLGVGLMVTLAASLTAEFLAHPDTLLPGPAAALLTAPLFAAGVGLSVWREVIRASVTGTATELTRTGPGLAIGLALGALITPTDAFNLYGTGVSPLGIMIPWLVFTYLSGLGIVHWIALVARCWLPGVARRDRPVPVILATLAAISVPLAAWLGITTMLPTMTLVVQTTSFPDLPAIVLMPLAAAAVAITIPPTPMLFPLLVTVAVLPLAGIAWSQRQAARPGAADWIALDPLPVDRLAPPPRSELRTTTRIGLWCAVAGLIMVAPLVARVSDIELVIQVAVVLTQFAAAVLASARTRQLRVLHGIAAAFLAGAGTLLFNVILVLLLTGETPPIRTLTMQSQAAGLLIATAVALLTTGLARAITRQRPQRRVPLLVDPDPDRSVSHP